MKNTATMLADAPVADLSARDLPAYCPDPLFGSEIGQRYQQLHRQILIAAEQTDTSA